jgi:hypothetical protein
VLQAYDTLISDLQSLQSASGEGKPMSDFDVHHGELCVRRKVGREERKSRLIQMSGII